MKLHRVTDWLQLAQGFLSNLPFLRREAEEVLSDVPGFKTFEGMHGSLVPEILKPQNHHLLFGT